MTTSIKNWTLTKPIGKTDNSTQTETTLTEVNATFKKILLQQKESTKPPATQFKTGTKQVQVNKIYIGEIQTHPRLAYIDFHVSSDSSPEVKLPIRALHDGGCAKTIISINLYNRLKDSGQVDLIKPMIKTVIVSCTGEHKELMGSVNLSMHFQGITA